MILTVIKGGSPLTDDEKQKIQDIFANSKCVNESLINTFECVTLMNDMLIIGNGTEYRERLVVADNGNI